jgi:hypothetical protein
MSCAAVALALLLANGYAKDVSGSSDYPAFSRIAGSTIVVYERKDQAENQNPAGTHHFRFANPEIQRLQNNLRFRSINSYTVRAPGWEHSAERWGIL